MLDEIYFPPPCTASEIRDFFNSLLEPMQGPIRQLMSEIIDGFRPLASAGDARVEYTVDGAEIAPVDRDAVRQILLNLLDNAVKYGPRGQTVRVFIENENGTLTLVVEDEGPGVPVADRTTVWERFTRRHSGDTSVAGAGIGLAVVQQLVSRHDGHVEIQDSPGGGARFLVALPHLPAPTPGRAAGARAQPAPGRAAGARTQPASERTADAQVQPAPEPVVRRSSS